MTSPIRWKVQDRYGNYIYLTQERWEHIIDPLNHPEMKNYEEGLKETVQSGVRKQDSLNPQKYRYSKEFDNLPSGIGWDEKEKHKNPFANARAEFMESYRKYSETEKG